MDPLKPRDKILALTSLRFFAAFWVMLYHTMPRDDVVGRAIAPLIDLGYTAVSLFFVLSGFILAKVYRQLRGRRNIARFFVARIARVYPIYLLTLLLDVPRLLFQRAAKLGMTTALMLTGATFAFQAAALQAWVPRLRALNFPSWSISTELFFYLMFPLILPLAERIGRNRDRLLIMALVLATNLAVAVLLHHPNSPPGGPGEMWQNPVLRLPEFVFGVLLAPLAAVEGRSGPPRHRWTLWLSPVIVVLGIMTIIATRSSIGDARISETLLTPIFGLVIVLMASTEDGLAKAISGRLLVLLGEASYALYLLHAPIVAIFLSAGLVPDHWWSPSYLAYVATTIAASIVLHIWVERPARRYIMHLWGVAVAQQHGRVGAIMSALGVASDRNRE